ncbi:nuclear transport factor 2 family protein [Actinomadura welshii]|uniref:nuclear transport factor 2 family protein n=1 Tax=Actinomadura welshii TaxID=3103817 RepID=UPI0003AD091D|nr:nuclear transport factor 2 family protein [Actinomadura madurae]
MNARERMVHAMCAAVDAGDAEAFGAWFADDATYRFGNEEPLTGRTAVIAATAAAAGALPRVRHTVDQVAEVGDRLFCRFTIETETPAGAPVALPCVTVIEMAGDTVADYRVHMDIGPALGAPLGLRPAEPGAVEVARAAFEGLQRGGATGDWSGFVDVLAEDVRIMIPVPAGEQEPPEGVLVGKDVARRMFAGHHEEMVAGVVLEAKRVAANGPLVVLEARVEGALDGEVVANHFVFAFEVRDGKVASMYEYAAWTAKSPTSRWGDPAFAREAWSETLIPYTPSTLVAG